MKFACCGGVAVQFRLTVPAAVKFAQHDHRERRRLGGRDVRLTLVEVRTGHEATTGHARERDRRQIRLREDHVVPRGRNREALDRRLLDGDVDWPRPRRCRARHSVAPPRMRGLRPRRSRPAENKPLICTSLSNEPRSEVESVLPDPATAYRVMRKESTGTVYIRKMPNAVSGTGAFAAAASPSASTRRVSSGSMIPSSHRRAVEK